MKINGSLVFDASSASEIQNLRVQKVSSLPTYTAADAGRMVYDTVAKILYYGTDVAFVAIATGGNAANLQIEVDAIETSLGAIVNGAGVWQVGAVTGPGAVSTSTSLTQLLQELADYANANNTLAELDDVALVAAISGDFLRYNGTAWTDSTISLATDLGITADAAELNTLDGITASTAELNILDGATVTAAELNILDGATLTTTELNFVDGVTSSIQDQLDNKQPLDATLTSLAALDATAGIVVQTAADTFVKRTLAAPAEGITISNPAGTAGNPTFALANDLAALEGLTTSGYIVRTGDGTATTRSMAVVSGELVITGAADGVSTDTTFGLATVTDSGTGTFLKLARDGFGRVTGTTAVTTADITTLVDTTYVNVAGDTMTGNLVMSTGFSITLPDLPVSGTDAANKAYVDALQNGLAWKQAVRVATTANGTLATAFAAGQVVDGVTLVAGDRVLLKDQTAPAENGIYVVQASGAPVRALDMNAAAEFDGAATFVQEGTANEGTGWTETLTVTTIGTSPVSFSQFSGGQAFVWGTGLANSGNTVFVNLGAGISELPSDEIGLDIVSNLAIQLTSSATGGQLTFVLDTGSGLEQSTAGLKISANGVTNAMIVNDTMVVNGDTGTGSLALGGTLEVRGTSTQGINTSVNGTGTFTVTAADASASQKGVASFSSNDFTVTAGNVVIAAAGVDNAQLANSTVTIAGTSGSDAVALGETLTFSSTVLGLVSSTVATNGVALDVRLADATNTGVASFDAAQFTVTAGAVSLTATLDDLTNVSSADSAATGDLLTKTAGDWQNVTRAAVVGSVTLNDIGDVAATHTDGHVLVSDGTNWVNQKVYHLYTSGSASTSHTVTHGLGVQFCNVTVVDSTDNVVIPESIVFTSTSALTVTFNTSIDCKVVVMGVA